MTDAPSTTDAILDAALALAAEQPWGTVTLAALAERAGVPLENLFGSLPTKTDVVDALARRFDARAAIELDLDTAGTARERAFDAAMARYDAMEPHRQALVSIRKAVTRDPVLAARAWAWQARTARCLLEMARIDTSGMAGFARVQGFAVMLVRVGRAWEDDDAGDLARTMAALDRQLRDVEEAGQRWPFARKARSVDDAPKGDAAAT